MMTRIRLLFQRNLPAKIVALVVAVILWVFVMNDQNPSIDGSFVVPLKVVNAPDGYKISRSDENVKIRVRGARSLFVSASADDFKAYVDLNGAESGKVSVKVQTVLPQGFELIDTQPDMVTFTLDKIIQKKVAADLIVTGASAPGTTVAKVNQNITQVTIEGPESAIAEVARVIGYVGLSGNSADFSLTVPLTAVNADGKAVDEVKVIPQSTQVAVQLARGLTKKIVNITPIFAGDLANGYVVGGVRVDPSKIEIAGDASVIDPITAINTEKISLAGITKTSKKMVKLDLPEGITVTNKDVNVSIDITEKK